jgi:hypothetical protein
MIDKFEVGDEAFHINWGRLVIIKEVIPLNRRDGTNFQYYVDDNTLTGDLWLRPISKLEKALR